MAANLTYAIKFVADMDKAVTFYRDIVGLPLKFQSPEWSEFLTGSTTLALHAASDKNPAGKVELGFGVPSLSEFHAELSRKGVKFSRPPRDEHGQKLAAFIDPDGAECSVTGR